jgi:hypothetical protein
LVVAELLEAFPVPAEREVAVLLVEVAVVCLVPVDLFVLVATPPPVFTVLLERVAWLAETVRPAVPEVVYAPVEERVLVDRLVEVVVFELAE